jgi:hypothetical protein
MIGSKSRNISPTLTRVTIHESLGARTRPSPLPQLALHRSVSDAAAGAFHRNFYNGSFSLSSCFYGGDLLSFYDLQPLVFCFAQCLAQIALCLVLFPQPRRIEVPKSGPFLVTCYCLGLEAFGADKSPQPGLECGLAELAMNRAGFNADLITLVSKNETVRAKVDSHTMSVRYPVKLFPTGGVQESLCVSCQPRLKRFLAGLGRNVVTSALRLSSSVPVLGEAQLVFKDSAQLGSRFIIGDRIVQA